MDAVQPLTGQGGWPMSVFLTPEGAAVLRRHLLPARRPLRLPGFAGLLQAVADAYAEPPGGLMPRRAGITESGAGAGLPRWGGGRPGPSLLVRVASVLRHAVRRRARWLRRQPKFPQPTLIDCSCACRYAAHRRRRPLAMAELTLDQMARGGLYDQLGGGFHRYSVDAPVARAPL